MIYALFSDYAGINVIECCNMIFNVSLHSAIGILYTKSSKIWIWNRDWCNTFNTKLWLKRCIIFDFKYSIGHSMDNKNYASFIWSWIWFVMKYFRQLLQTHCRPNANVLASLAWNKQQIIILRNGEPVNWPLYAWIIEDCHTNCYLISNGMLCICVMAFGIMAFDNDDLFFHEC